jgi:hypothetical protein
MRLPYESSPGSVVSELCCRVVDGHQQHRQSWVRPQQLSGELEPVAIREVNVEQHGVRAQRVDRLYRSSDAVGFAHNDVPAELEQLARGLTKDGSVVDHQHALTGDRAHPFEAGSAVLALLPRVEDVRRTQDQAPIGAALAGGLTSKGRS